MDGDAFILEVDLEVLVNVLTGVEPCLQFFDKDGDFVQITAAELIENGVTIEALALAESAELDGSTSTEEIERSLSISPSENGMNLAGNRKRKDPSRHAMEERDAMWLNWGQDSDSVDLLSSSNSASEPATHNESTPSCAPSEAMAIETIHTDELSTSFDNTSCEVQAQTDQEN
ncbi:hypothetical protein M514_17425 [Trichuris suis]|uniref:Uncharacterized protein n=1 Tax=Trichuris suis TaxID=68888 RepID=A0A085NLJ5_9BILA|nr:hypothetical protein M514_17425 [Trichuris suis]KHJ47848.1 hypothetical protein D918_02007 [Trichuris suis]